MSSTGKYRSLASLALLRLSESDLRSLHKTVSDMSPTSFLELLRDIEDEIDNSMSAIQDQVFEDVSFDPGAVQMYEKLNQIRTKELRVSVQRFVDLLFNDLSPIAKKKRTQIPRFDPRRGLEAWIGKLNRVFSEQEVYHAAMRIRYNSSDEKRPDWKLR